MMWTRHSRIYSAWQTLHAGSSRLEANSCHILITSLTWLVIIRRLCWQQPQSLLRHGHRHDACAKVASTIAGILPVWGRSADTSCSDLHPRDNVYILAGCIIGMQETICIFTDFQGCRLLPQLQDVSLGYINARKQMHTIIREGCL